MAHPRSRAVAKRGTVSRGDAAFFSVLALFVAAKAGSELKRLLLGAKPAEKDAETASLRGKSFKVVAGDPVNLSISGALPFYVFTALICHDAVKVLRFGPRAFDMAPILVLRNVLILAFTGIPFIEGFLAEDWSNPEASQFREGQRKDRPFRGSLYAWALVELLTTYGFTKTALRKDMRRRDAAALAVLLGIYNGGFGITVAHELLHKPRASDKLVGRALLTNVCYLHWEQEHLVGHHAHVATPADPATARRGQTLYEFLPQTVLGSIASSWRLHEAEVAKRGASASKALFALRNLAPPLLWALALAKATRRRLREVLPFFALQASVAVLLLEMVNYIEHYGLARSKLPDGSYEAPNPTHSWNSAHWFSNALLFKLQRHSDHHTFPQRPFQLLRNFEESPQLPTGYLGMLALACFPPVFFRVMDPVVDCHNSDNGSAKEAEKRAAKHFQLWNAAFLASCIGATALYHRRN